MKRAAQMTESAVLADQTPFARKKRYTRLKSIDTAADRGSHCRSRLFVPRRELVRSFVFLISVHAILKVEGLGHAFMGRFLFKSLFSKGEAASPMTSLADASFDNV